jgi:hypothetical protein
MGQLVKQLEVIRLEKTEEGILGDLLIDGIIFCRTLEHPTLALKTGTYPAVFEYSPKFKKKLYELKQTGDRDEVKFHVANLAEELEGCIALGKYQGYLEGKRAVLASGSTIKRFHAELKKEPVTVSILDLTGL